MRQPPTAAGQLLAELDAVAGETCGHTCAHHGEVAVCARAPGHDGATVATDLHAFLVDGHLVTFGEECCAAEEGEAP